MMKDRPLLVQEVIKHLLEKINEGVYVDQYGGRLPSEQELCQEFGVSRTTIREAIAQLSANGIVIRRPGIGIFVNRPLRGALRSWPYEKSSFLQLIRKAGHEPAQKLLFCGVHHDPRYTKRFALKPDEPLFAIEKVLFSDEVPVIHAWNVLPLSFIHEEYLEEVERGYPCEESVYTFLKKKCRREVAYHDSDIRADSCPESLVDLLEISLDMPLLRLDEVAYDKMSSVLFYGISYLRSDKISFHIRRGLSLEF